jgi:hypothetical protein
MSLAIVNLLIKSESEVASPRFIGKNLSSILIPRIISA